MKCEGCVCTLLACFLFLTKHMICLKGKIERCYKVKVGAGVGWYGYDIAFSLVETLNDNSNLLAARNFHRMRRKKDLLTSVTIFLSNLTEIHKIKLVCGYSAEYYGITVGKEFLNRWQLLFFIVPFCVALHLQAFIARTALTEQAIWLCLIWLRKWTGG